MPVSSITMMLPVTYGCASFASCATDVFFSPSPISRMSTISTAPPMIASPTMWTNSIIGNAYSEFRITRPSEVASDHFAKCQSICATADIVLDHLLGLRLGLAPGERVDDVRLRLLVAIKPVVGNHAAAKNKDRKSTRLNSSHVSESRMP